MSTGLARPELLTFEQYLELEATSPVPHEYHQGLLVQMSLGVSRAHDVVACNALVAIRGHIPQGAPCRVHLSGLALRVEAADASYYPDLHVTCDPRDHADPRVSRHPSLIIEILSRTTRDYDAGTKFADYKLLESLREYVLIDSEVQAATVYRRTGERQWNSTDLGPGDSLELSSIGLTLPLAVLYEASEVPRSRPRPRLV